MRQIIIPMTVCLAVFSCKKDSTQSEANKMTFSGRILKSSDSSTAYVNTSFVFYEIDPPNAFSRKREETTPFTTDESGFFSVEVDPLTSYGSIHLCLPNWVADSDCPNQFSFTIPRNTGNDLGIIYMP